MMMQVMKNSALCAKVSAMTGKALSDADYDALMNLKSIPAVASYLIENTSYGAAFRGVSSSELHRARLERMLREHLRADIKRIMPFMSDGAKKFIQAVSLGEGIEKIKLCLRLIRIGHAGQIAEYMSQIPIGRGSIPVSQIEKVENIDGFIELLRQTPYFAALEVFEGRPERQKLFRMETALDAYFAGMVYKCAKKYLTGDEAKSVFKIYGTEFDLENLTFLLRCKKSFEMKDDEIYAGIIPKHYRLKEETIAKIVKSGSYDDAVSIIAEETPYGQAFSTTDRFIEKRQEQYLTDLKAHIANVNQYSIQSPIHYIHLRRMETNNIISIAEGIRYGLPPDKIKDYLVGYGRGGAEI